jgi:hypothetical protein
VRRGTATRPSWNYADWVVTCTDERLLATLEESAWRR